MRVVIQRVTGATLDIDGSRRCTIGPGIVVLIGIEEADGPEDVEWLAGKVARLRIFNDEAGVMNKSVVEAGGDALLVSQFTLHASTKKGNRPSYIRAARPEQAIPIYESFVRAVERELAKPIATGIFGADMQITLTNDGPVTIWIDSKARE